MSVSTIDQFTQLSALLDEAYTLRTSNLKKSIQLAKKALSTSKLLGDKVFTAKSLGQLSLFYMIVGEYGRSVSMAKTAINLFKELGDERGIADAKYNIAGAYYKTNNYHLGLTYLMKALAIFRKFNDYHNQARTLKSLGTIYEYFGDEKNAVRTYQNAIEAGKKAKDKNLISNAYNPLSGIYLKQGRIKTAFDVIEQSIAMKNETGDVRGLAFAIYGRGKVYLGTGQYDEAEKDFLEAIGIHTSTGEKLGLAMAYYKLSLLYIEWNKLDEARPLLLKAIDFSKKYNIVITHFKCEYLLYRVYKLEGQTEKALESLERYLNLKETVINAQTLKVIENYELITKMESLEKEAQLQRERAEFIEKKDRAEQSAKMKQEFLSTMSHEIRTPLNAVITITSLLSDKSEKDEEELLKSLKYASNNLLLIINDILDFTKLDTGKVQVDNRPCEIRGLLDRITKTYERLASEKGLDFTLKVDDAVSPSYEIDETKISQILGNLVSNAIKYTDKGRVKLQVDLMQKGDAADKLRFCVTDTGWGIPDDYYDRLFESFSQPKSVTTRKQGGSGLGLAIVKKLVELYGGAVNVKSKVGKGSSFYFELELKKAEVKAPIATKLLTQLDNKTVLLADDNMINAMVARKLLSKWGIVAEHAINGVEAVAKSKQKVFDYILMDIHMPEMNGFDATVNIREQSNPNAKTPIFALTADITAENQDEYSTYFNGFLRKPIEIDKLHQALMSCSAM